MTTDPKILMQKAKLIKAKLDELGNHFTSLYELSKKTFGKTIETRSTEEFLHSTANISDLFDSYDKLSDEMHQINLNLDDNYTPNYKPLTSMQILYSKIKQIRENVMLAKQKQADSKPASAYEVPMTVKLPPLQIKSFDGNYINWNAFYQSFKINIHDNKLLPEDIKVQYLLSHLSNKALSVVAGIEPTGTNYGVIWEALVHKYEDIRSLGCVYLNNILDLKHTTNQADQLNQFVEVLASSEAALKLLKIDDLPGFILLHLAMKKIDSQLLHTFETLSRDSKIPSFSEFITFLRHQVKILERTTIANSSYTKSQNFHKTSQSSGSLLKNPRTKSSHTFSATTEENKLSVCCLCKSTAHSRLYYCPDFKKLPIQSRFEFIKRNKYCINCLSDRHSTNLCASNSTCNFENSSQIRCGKKHHTMLHFQTAFHQSPKSKIHNQLANSQVSTTNSAEQSNRENNLTLHSSGAFEKQNKTIVLATAQVFATSASGEDKLIRCLLDNASQNNLISSVACDSLNLRVKPMSGSNIKSIGSTSTPVKGYVILKIKSRFTKDEYTIKLLVVDNIVDKLPTENVDAFAFSHLESLPLADELWHIPNSVDVILGAQLFPHIFLGNRILSAPHEQNPPPLHETTLGYVIMGEMPIQSGFWSFGPLTSAAVHDGLTKFWELEELPSLPNLQQDEVESENHYSSTVVRCTDGRYSVSLPFKSSPNLLGNSFVTAKRRLFALERKFDRDPNLRISYNQVILDYLAKGYLSEIDMTAAETRDGYVIPHHAILKPDRSTTKTRIVLDASCKTDTGVSLNEVLHVGPNLQADLFTLLLKFRLFPVALSADIQQMYLRIYLHEDHRKYQRILYRFDNKECIRAFVFNSLAFGLTCSPFLAMRTIRQLASDEHSRFPLAAEVAQNELYMDDLITSVESVEKGVKLSNELIEMFSLGGFALTKWASNSSSVLASLPDTQRAQFNFSDDNSLKVLGLLWLPESDQFHFTTSNVEVGCTKRIILSTIARLFDVLGLVAPVILYAKILIQDLWLANIGWDDPTPTSIQERFIKLKKELPLLSSLSIPRHLSVFENTSTSIVGFADASMKAYGCVIYLHVTNPSGATDFRLVCSKSKVAPLKTVSLARLELCASLLLSQLIKLVWDTYKEKTSISNIFAFSDSTIALSWIHSSPHRWQTFVANRVAKIHENLSPNNFYHINGNINPSDCLSRGLLPAQLIKHSLWWHGPSWARNPIVDWPVEPFSDSQHVECPPELKKTTLTATSIIKESFLHAFASRFSSYQKLLNSLVYIYRFAKLIARSERIEVSHIEQVEIYLLYDLQQLYFSEEFMNLKKGNLLSPHLRKLDLFIDNNKLLRVGGRLANSNLPFENCHPILLPRRDHVVNLIIDYFHKSNLHAGSDLLMSILRQRYWILSARTLIRQRVRSCNFCFRVAPKLLTPPKMSDLPTSRVVEAKAFTNTGVDYAGPINITLTRRRGVKSQKAYICLFICLVTKAIHLEVASDLTTDSFINALKRFLSRRGPVSTILSDNGTNFVGAKNHLSELYEFLNKESTKFAFCSELNSKRIRWCTNPPKASHFGGIWEANIKSVKSHLYKTIGKQILCYEEFLTVLTQIEAICNSRPLCLMEDTPQPELLTPAHFLMSTPLQSLPAYDVVNSNVNLLTRKSLLDNLVQSYWKRWHRDYLHTLQIKQKWNTPNSPLTSGKVVLLQEDNVPPLHWPLGVVEDVFPGKDGKIRVVSVRTSKGLYKRPVVKLSPLPSQ